MLHDFTLSKVLSVLVPRAKLELMDSVRMQACSRGKKKESISLDVRFSEGHAQGLSDREH